MPEIKKRHLIDYSILIPYFILSIIGLIMVYSTTSSFQIVKGLPPTKLVIGQLQFWILSLITMFFIFKMKTSVYQNKGFIMVSIAVISVLLIAVRFTSLGQVINGSKGWLKIGSFSMQPAEYLKIMVIWYLAFILGRRQKYIDKDFKKAVCRPIVLVSFLIFLVAIQPDLGNAAILTLLVIVMLLASGINYMYTYIVGGIGIIGSIAVIQGLMRSKGQFIPDRFQYVYNRFAVFLNPFTDERGTGHQLINSYYAISNGGWFGRGLGNSIQKKGFLPEAHSDFVFAIMIEELGLIVSMLVLALLLFMIARIFLVGVRSKKPFNSLMCIGIGTMLLLQIFINIGGLTGIIPLTGVTFPFLSHGGNSLLVVSISIAFVLNISADEKKQKINQEIKINKIGK